METKEFTLISKIKENKKLIIKLLILSIILYIIYIFAVNWADIKEGFISGWESVE